jgi:hypothetical protein
MVLLSITPSQRLPAQTAAADKTGTPRWLPASLSAERRGIATVPNLVTGMNLPPIDERRSLIVTDKVILDHFSFAEVMATLAGQASDSGLSPLLLFRQWWTSQGKPPCLHVQLGFPYECREEAGKLAYDDPFHTLSLQSEYIPIGIFNRIDLAPKEGSDCGEYRIVFARKSSDKNDKRRLLINFEALLPNPNPNLGLAGCKPIAEFWHALRAENDPLERARELRRFYFKGLPGFLPAVHIENYGARTCWSAPCASGQIRTNERLEEPWILREFKVLPTWSGSPLRVRIVPATIKDSPYGWLVCCGSGGVTPEMVTAFRLDFKRSVRTLAQPDLQGKPDLHDFTHEIDPRFDAGHGTPEPGSVSDLHYRFVNTSNQAKNDLHKAIRDELDDMKIKDLEPDVIIGRAQALTCAGCHRISAKVHNSQAPTLKLKDDAVWPESHGFEHITEEDPEMGENGLRYRVSKAVLAFLPKRKEMLGYVLTR